MNHKKNNNQSSKNINGVGQVGNNTYIDNSELKIYVEQLNKLLSKKFDDLEREILLLKRDSKIIPLPKRIYWVWLIAIVALGFSIISLFIDVIPYTNWNVETVSLSIILAFVGFLATFVVISNYAQVDKIEKKFDKKTQEIKEKTSNEILGTIFFNLGMYYASEKNYNVSITSYIKSLHSIYMANADIVQYNLCYDGLVEIYKEMRKNKQNCIFDNISKQNYINMLVVIKDPRLNEIIKYLQESHSVEDLKQHNNLKI
jgi:uncharacterized membrane protein (DUF485 family)